MEPLASKIDPFANDPSRWAHSLAHLADIMFPCLDAIGARSVVEVGAYAGDLTAVLLEWAAASGARVWAIDPAPQDRLVALDEEHPDLELVRETSHEALRHVPIPDAVIIDGDHNYYTVREELRLIGERAPGAELPLLLFHDVSWPHARRDDYFAPELIPADDRHPVVPVGQGIFPGASGTRPDGLPYRGSAAREGGERNGVLSAVEDFVADRDGLRLAMVPAFFGLGIVWHREAPWAQAVEAIVEPWDRNPLLERLEANRVLHIATSHAHLAAAIGHQQRSQRLEAVLRRLLESSAFSLAERLSRLRQRAGVASGQPAVSKEAVRRALAE